MENKPVNQGLLSQVEECFKNANAVTLEPITLKLLKKAMDAMSREKAPTELDMFQYSPLIQMAIREESKRQYKEINEKDQLRARKRIKLGE